MTGEGAKGGAGMTGEGARGGAGKARRGRLGEASGRSARRDSAKLDEQAVMMVRDLRAAGVQVAALAAMAGVHPATVIQVVAGRTWRGLPEGDAPRGASVLLSLPELLTRRERMLVRAALGLEDGARGDCTLLYCGQPLRAVPCMCERPHPAQQRVRAGAWARAARGPAQLAEAALSHPSRWRETRRIRRTGPLGP